MKRLILIWASVVSIILVALFLVHQWDSLGPYWRFSLRPGQSLVGFLRDWWWLLKQPVIYPGGSA